MAELVTICDLAGQARGSGFVADDRGTVVTSHEAVEGLSRVVLHAPGPAGRTWLAEAGDVTALPGLALALVRTDGLGMRPLPVAVREAIAPGTYVRLPARGWRQARVLGGAEVTYPTAGGLHAVPARAAMELAIGTDGRDALSLGGEACGGPVLDAETGAVLAVLGTALRAEHRSGGFAVALRAAAVADPAGPLAALLERNTATVPAYGPDLNLAGILELTGTTVGAAFPPDEAEPGFDPVERPGTAAELEAFTAGDRLVLGLVGEPGTGRTTALAALAVRRARGSRPAPTLWLRGADLTAGDTSLADAVTRALAAAARIVTAGDPAEPGDRPAAEADAEQVARVAGEAGRALLVVLDAPEEMPPELAHRLGPWTEATVGWLRAAGARLAVAARPEHWERAGALCPPEVLHTPARPARRMPPALPLGDLTAAEAETARARLGIPEGAVREADARHPLTLRLLAGIRAAEVTAGRPGRDEVFAAHLDLLCLRAAVRVAADQAGGARVHGPGVRRLATRMAGRVHEAARRCLGPGQGSLARADFEELFPWRTGWASAVLTEGLLVPAGPGFRFAHEELSDWIQAFHLDVPTALASLVHRPAGPGLPVPRHRIGPVLEALRRLPAQSLRGELQRLVDRLNALAEAGTGAAEPDRVWWAARLLRETLLRAPDAHPHLPVLHALAEHVARAGPGEFGGWFWNRLRLPEPDRLDLLRRLLPADPAEAVPGDRYLDAAARRLVRDPRFAQPLLCAWFTDGRRLRGRPGATVATAAQALLHTHRRLAVDDLTEALVTAAHPRADELLAVLAEEEPSAMCRAVDRWAHDERPGRRVAAAAYGLATAPHVRTPADRELLRYAAQTLLARPADAALHGSALATLLRDPQVRGRYLPDALACFRAPEHGPRLPAAALVAALPVLPDPDAVFDALRERADGEVVRALAALTTPGLARRAGDLVREHLARRPEDAPHAAAFVDRRLEQGPAAGPVLRPLVLDLLRSAPAAVRAELAAVLAAPGGEPSYALRGELADVLLRKETDPRVLDAFLGAVAAGAAARPEDRTRELLRRTGRQLLGAPGGPAVFERRTVELARSDPAFGAFVARWLAQAGAEAAALLGPSARRTVETLSRAAPDVT
ncbi:serine protease [Streptomyces sp. NBC_00047]|uniref:serine protease n=1 Tax=Streptomyces sp. NBC_00047 TaxID=2975627 RepID=UPI002250052A|nr:serine protease [Streptomyces sp. NBC_00047]MCX5611877.1 serine protease [Streptomyces sp. NBC_00047]